VAKIVPESGTVMS